MTWNFHNLNADFNIFETLLNSSIQLEDVINFHFDVWDLEMKLADYFSENEETLNDYGKADSFEELMRLYAPKDAGGNL